MHFLSDNFSRSVQTARRFLRPMLPALALGLASCSSPARGPIIEPGAYLGPEVTIDSTTREHIAVVNSPSGGWRCTLDQVREAYQTQRAYITLRKPNPGLYNTQAIVEQRIGTEIPRNQNVEVYARLISFDDISPEEIPYHLATKSEGNKQPLPPRERERPRPAEGRESP